MATSIAIPSIRRSPATLQYHVPYSRPKKFYEPRFTIDRDDRVQLRQWFDRTDPMMPPYPYGKDVKYPEADQGLYGGLTIQSGNKISSGRNKGKTLRKWYPNVKMERIRSEALDQEFTIPIAARVIRTIRKVGGLDEYLTGTKPARVKELGLLGWKMRWMVINSPKWKEKFAEEAQAAAEVAGYVNAKNPLLDTFQKAWANERRRDELVEKQVRKWVELRAKDERFTRHYMQNVVSDRTGLKVPELQTLSLHDPVTLGLRHARVHMVRASAKRDTASEV